ncbi:sensor histidine kinase [Rhodococcus rhodochrous]|uniref:sensor histidine kinase n=1 Tax=Rhodococcus rhodochrous TaxID=1829 RepID=UPI001E2D0A54|nr:histidine kinase [Rhodococcus rhodochrous]MCD2098954.1 histidine kinase [Rhodococcus rhodochrous]MCD2123460.1 histidine kinase [Rhodococcus rhodochrous]MCQ4135125.1 histidine kinase [Rhodococcus rhodochrous]MDJ0020140.1 histidine kinase [Rhodococcus rhodochrous]
MKGTVGTVATNGSAGTGAPVPAAVVAVASWLLAVAAVVVFVAARPALDSDQLFFLVDVVGAAVYGTVAGVILARQVHAVPILLAVASIGVGVAAVSYSWTQLALVRPELPVGFLGPLQNTTWIPGTLALFLVVPWLVRDRPADPVIRAGIGLGILTIAWFFWARTFTDIADIRFVGPVVAVGFLTAGHVEWRRRHAPDGERSGTGWLALGSALMTASYIPLAVPDVPWMLTPLLHLATQAFYPVAILAVVLRQRLWGIDLAVGRAALAGSLTAVLVTCYLAVTVAVSLVLPNESVFAQAVAATAVALAVQPVRTWLGRKVHRLVYGDGVDPARAVRILGRHFAGADSPDLLLGELAAGIGTALRLESVEVRRGGDVIARWGTATGPVEEVPVGSGDATLAVTAPPGESLGTRSRRALIELATVVDAGLVVLRSAEDLEGARRRLTEVRLEERRTIRRELHDGLGPSLAGVRLGLQGARNLVTTDPDAAAGLVDELLRELDRQVDGVRELSRSLLPPVLDELGLTAALDELVITHARAGFRVDLQSDLPAGMSGPIAWAAYGIASEAIINARRHSGTDECTVRVAAEGDVLVLDIVDDGRGLATDARVGVGTQSMRERAREVGGTVGIEPGDLRGVVVRARLPWSES